MHPGRVASETEFRQITRINDTKRADFRERREFRIAKEISAVTEIVSTR
jgi:hypothetical protein